MRTNAVLGILATALIVVVPANAFSGEDLPGSTHWALAWSATVPFYGSVMEGDDTGTVVAGYHGEVVALDLAGAARWSVQTPLDEVVNRPALVADVVVVPAHRGMAALERSSGATLWSSTLEGARVAAGSVEGQPVLLVTTPDGVLRTIDPATGSELMSRTLPSPRPDGAPPVRGSQEVAVVAWGVEDGCCTIAAFDATDGRMLWRRAVTQRSTEPIVHDGVVIVAMNPSIGRSRGRLVALDASTGAPRWRAKVRGRFAPGLKSDAADDLVVVPTKGGAVIAVDVDDGRIRWQSDAVIPAERANPKITSGQVFLTPHSTDLVAFDRSTGDVVSGGPIEQTIVVTDTNVVAGHLQLLVTNGFEAQVWNVDPEGLRTD